MHTSPFIHFALYHMLWSSLPQKKNDFGQTAWLLDSWPLKINNPELVPEACPHDLPPPLTLKACSRRETSRILAAQRSIYVTQCHRRGRSAASLAALVLFLHPSPACTSPRQPSAKLPHRQREEIDWRFITAALVRQSRWRLNGLTAASNCNPFGSAPDVNHWVFVRGYGARRQHTPQHTFYSPCRLRFRLCPCPANQITRDLHPLCLIKWHWKRYM